MALELNTNPHGLFVHERPDGIACQLEVSHVGRMWTAVTANIRHCWRRWPARIHESEVYKDIWAHVEELLWVNDGYLMEKSLIINQNQRWQMRGWLTVTRCLPAWEAPAGCVFIFIVSIYSKRIVAKDGSRLLRSAGQGQPGAPAGPDKSEWSSVAKGPCLRVHQPTLTSRLHRHAQEEATCFTPSCWFTHRFLSLYCAGARRHSGWEFVADSESAAKGVLAYAAFLFIQDAWISSEASFCVKVIKLEV